MIPRPLREVVMLRSVIVLALCAGLTAAAADDPDPIRKKLDDAKAAFDHAALQFRVGVLDWYDKQEDTARNAGNKKLVDQIIADREQFRKSGVHPPDTPKNLLQQYDTARKAREASFQTAIKEYTRARMDALAKQTQDDLREFRYSLNPLAQEYRGSLTQIISHSGRVLCPHGAAKTDGTRVHQWDRFNNPDQRWILLPAEDDCFLVLNDHSRTFMRAGAKDTVIISKGDEETDRSMHWKLVPVKSEPGRFHIQNRATGKYISLAGDGGGAGVLTIQSAKLNGPSGSKGQQWRIEKVGKDEKGGK